MTVTVHLPKSVEDWIVSHARARGISVDAYVQLCLEHSANATAQPNPVPLSSEEFDLELDEIADEIAAALPPGAPPLSDYAMSRESIYVREDEWNR